MMPIVTWGMSTLDSKYTSHGTALLTSLRTISGSIGSAVFVAVLQFASCDFCWKKPKTKEKKSIYEYVYKLIKVVLKSKIGYNEDECKIKEGENYGRD